jgi:tRNA U34 5-methylaminomethyl-2-thiouridine-forming methyltransferase MnmC
MLTNKQSVSPKKELVLCEDGSYTLFSHEFNEPYHSTKDGALQESLRKHVEPSLVLKLHKEELTILDICFGLGYNTFATLYYVKKHKLKTKLHIISPEFDKELVASLDRFNYPFEFDGIKHIIKAISREFYYEDEQFKIEILIGDARQSIPKIKKPIDIVYQDAFSPTHNPLLWTYEWFGDIKTICKEDAVLTTYSTAASTRLGLYENGFYIFLNNKKDVRNSIVASLKMIDEFEYIDMELKKIRNPSAKSLKDRDFNSSSV